MYSRILQHFFYSFFGNQDREEDSGFSLVLSLLGAANQLETVLEVVKMTSQISTPMMQTCADTCHVTPSRNTSDAHQQGRASSENIPPGAFSLNSPIPRDAT